MRPGPLGSLVQADVVDFARREIAATVGLDCPARFFLSGGAFKSLLTGKQPRDLDLWAPSPEDRELLVRRLEERGATPLPRRPYSDAWMLDGQVVEIPVKTEPDTLEERHGRYDIALSAVGVEHDRGRSWRAVIHPLAARSVERREVLLLKPLVNRWHALTTLERLRRYAGELDFAVPASEDDEVWAVFDAADADEQRRMLERLAVAGRPDLGVREEALCRLR